MIPLRPLWHMGALHPVEQWLTLVLAFGPFVVLGIVIWLRRREDATADTEHDGDAVHDADPGTPQSPSRTARPKT